VRLKVKYKPSSQATPKTGKGRGNKKPAEQTNAGHEKTSQTFSHSPLSPPGFFGGKGGVTEGLLMWFSHPTSPRPFQKRLTFHSRHDIFTLSLFVFFSYFCFACVVLFLRPASHRKTPRKNTC